MVADELAAAKVPVLTGAMNNIPSQLRHARPAAGERGAARARPACRSALIGNAGGGDEEAFNVRNIRYEAGNAVAYGMTGTPRCAPITLDARRDLRRRGSGRLARSRASDANVVVWSGDPFEFATQPEHVFVRGVQEIRQPSRQDLLEAAVQDAAAGLPKSVVSS